MDAGCRDNGDHRAVVLPCSHLWWWCLCVLSQCLVKNRTVPGSTTSFAGAIIDAERCTISPPQRAVTPAPVAATTSSKNVEFQPTSQNWSSEDFQCLYLTTSTLSQWMTSAPPSLLLASPSSTPEKTVCKLVYHQHRNQKKNSNVFSPVFVSFSSFSLPLFSFP